MRSHSTDLQELIGNVPFTWGISWLKEGSLHLQSTWTSRLSHVNNSVLIRYNLTIPLHSTQSAMVLEWNVCVTVFRQFSYYWEFFCDWNRVALPFVNCKSFLKFLSGFCSNCLCFFFMWWCKSLLFLTFLTCCYHKPWPEGKKLLCVSLLAFCVCVLGLQIWVAMVTGN